MYLEIVGGRQAQKWIHRDRTARRNQDQPGGAAGLRRRAEDELNASGAGAGFPLSYDESQRLLKEVQALTEANAELEAFNAAVSHDLCTPLTAINGYCQVLSGLCSDQLDAQSLGYLRGIYDATLRMKALISSQLDFARLTRVALRRERIDLSEMAKQVAAELRLTEPQRLVTFRVARGVTVNGDPGLCRSVLDNLIGNAWKYSSGREKTVIEFGVRRLGGKPVCFVRDNGPGFDMAWAVQLFVPFQRIPGTAVEGHGIGMATVDKIIRRHGGRVWAESKPGGGASFYFTLE
jgi:signal transduction histidine kinase